MNNRYAKCINHDWYTQCIRFTVMLWIVIAEIAVGILAVWPMLFARGEFALPLRAWQPYDVESGLSYWLSYLHQGMALLLSAAYDVANDTIITGLAHACAQLELITSRLQEMSCQVSGALTKRVPKEAIRTFEQKIVNSVFSIISSSFGKCKVIISAFSHLFLILSSQHSVLVPLKVFFKYFPMWI